MTLTEMPPSSRSVLRLVLLALFASVLFLSHASASPPEAPSPAAEAELICHTDDVADCYPRVFSPTEEFQVVRDDQDLPPGLHVKLNIWTGEKEARLNIPGGEDAALEGLPVDQSVVVVEPEASEAEAPSIPKNAPAYDAFGVAKEQPDEGTGFPGAVGTLKKYAGTAASTPQLAGSGAKEAHPLDAALVTLEDLSHDVYWGQKITEDSEAVASLFCLLTQRDADEVRARPFPDRRDFLASSILSSSLQNNPPALRNVEADWDALMKGKCAASAQPLKVTFFRSLEPLAAKQQQAGTSADADADYANEATWMRTTVPVVGRLLKSDAIRPQLMGRGVMGHFLRVLANEGEAWDPVRARVARIVSDTFLDENVGAQLGIWPLGAQAAETAADGSSVCELEGSRFADGCWEHHLQKTAKGKPKDHWSHQLLAMVKLRRPERTGSSGPGRSEL